MIENYIRITRKLSNQFDIILTKELYYSLLVRGFDMTLIISFDEDKIKICLKKNFYRNFAIKIFRLFYEKYLSFVLTT